jgi:hypothetical protein
MNHVRTILFSLIFYVSNLLARQGVLEIETNDHLMKVVNLTLGRSTVLSFDDKPVKVVLGNSNYFNVEFIGNDLTIQPLANIETNLFVYTQKQLKYGFLIKAGNLSTYHDMIYVRWKSLIPETVIPNEKSQRFISLKVPKVDLLSNGLSISLVKMSKLSVTNTYLLDFEIKNLSKKVVGLDSVDFYFTQNLKRFSEQKLVFEKKGIMPKEKILARIIAKLSRANCSVNLVHQKKISQKIISKASL